MSLRESYGSAVANVVGSRWRNCQHRNVPGRPARSIGGAMGRMSPGCVEPRSPPSTNRPIGIREFRRPDIVPRTVFVRVTAGCRNSFSRPSRAAARALDIGGHDPRVIDGFSTGSRLRRAGDAATCIVSGAGSSCYPSSHFMNAIRSPIWSGSRRNSGIVG